MSNKEKATKISWLTLAFMAFSTVWGFGNITNGFVYFNGPQVIFSWIFMFVLYFIPYALMVAVLSGSIILAQSFVPGAAAVLRQLTKLNSVCMPMRYLWVFAAYIALRNAYDTIPAEYRFVKNQAVAKFFGGWCFAVTAVCCVLGMYDKDPFTFALNVITPVVLTVLGFILPALAKREQTAAKK